MATQIDQDAASILRALDTAPRGEYIDGRALADQVALSPERINDAVSLLVDAGLVEWNQTMGTMPFDFADVIITARGRREVQSLSEPTPAPVERARSANAVRLFISHASDDSLVASQLVQLVRAALNLPSTAIRCTSVDGYRLPGGADTDEQLRTEVHDSEAFVGIVSTGSMRSPYVLFELGARWGAKLHLIPLLAPGSSAAVLGGPLLGLNALQAGNASQLHQLVAELGTALGISPEAPHVYQAQLEAVLRTPAGNSSAENQPASMAKALDRSGLLSELEFNRRIAQGAASDAQGCAFRDQQFSNAVASGLLGTLAREVQDAVSDAYVATGAATRLVEAAWRHPKGGNSWAVGVNEASKRIRESVPLLERAISVLRS